MKIKFLEIEGEKGNFYFYECKLTPVGKINSGYSVDEFWGSVRTSREVEVELTGVDFDFDFGTFIDQEDNETHFFSREIEVYRECVEKIKEIYRDELEAELIGE